MDELTPQDIQRLKQRDPAAWNRVIRRYTPYLCKLAGAKLQTAPKRMQRQYAASDFVDQTWGKACRAIKTFQYMGPESLRRWLAKILKNVFIDAIRFEKRRARELSIDDHNMPRTLEFHDQKRPAARRLKPDRQRTLR